MVRRSVLVRGLAAEVNVTRATTRLTAVVAGILTVKRLWLRRARTVRTCRPFTEKATDLTWAPRTVTVNRRSAQLRVASSAARAETTRVGDTAWAGACVLVGAVELDGGVLVGVLGGELGGVLGGVVGGVTGGVGTAVFVNVHAFCSSGLSSTPAREWGTSMTNGSSGSGGVATQWIAVSVQPGSGSWVTVKSWPRHSGTAAVWPSRSWSVTLVGGRLGHVGPVTWNVNVAAAPAGWVWTPTVIVARACARAGMAARASAVTAVHVMNRRTRARARAFGLLSTIFRLSPGEGDPRPARPPAPFGGMCGRLSVRSPTLGRRGF
jgi:hypothetical protein